MKTYQRPHLPLGSVANPPVLQPIDEKIHSLVVGGLQHSQRDGIWLHFERHCVRNRLVQRVELVPLRNLPIVGPWRQVSEEMLPNYAIGGQFRMAGLSRVTPQYLELVIHLDYTKRQCVELVVGHAVQLCSELRGVERRYFCHDHAAVWANLVSPVRAPSHIRASCSGCRAHRISICWIAHRPGSRGPRRLLWRVPPPPFLEAPLTTLERVSGRAQHRLVGWANRQTSRHLERTQAFLRLGS